MPLLLRDAEGDTDDARHEERIGVPLGVGAGPLGDGRRALALGDGAGQQELRPQRGLVEHEAYARRPFRVRDARLRERRDDGGGDGVPQWLVRRPLPQQVRDGRQLLLEPVIGVRTVGVRRDRPADHRKYSAGR
jgi:hypothetical protein